MKRNPEIGDVVRIGNGKKDQLVIFDEDFVDVDYGLGGGTRCGLVFVTIPYVVGDIVDPKEKAYLISNYDNSGESETKVDLDDIAFVCKAKFKEKITRTFTVKE